MKKIKQMKNKQMYCIALLIIFVIVSNLALAQNIPTNVQPLSKVFNEANPELFDYINGDYSTVAWPKIPPNFISKIPKDKLKYEQLKPEQRIKMTPDQISVNFEEINDLSKDVDADNARLAIKNKFNVNVIQLGSAKIRSGILHANDGYMEHINLNNKYYQSGLISIFAQTGEIVFMPLEEEINVPEQDTVTINADQQELKYKGYVVKEGGLSFKEGKTFIKPNGDSVIINDVLINPTKNHAIDIYFEPLTNPNGNYVAFFKEGLDIGTTKEGTIIVMPKPGNLLFNMVKREYKKDKEGKLIRDEFVLVEDDRDKLFLVVTKGDSLKVVSRAKEGKTPLIRHFYGGGETNIQTGRGMRFTFINGKLSYRPPKPVSEKEVGKIDTTSSVAFELVSDTDFNTVVRTSSSNRFIQTYNGKQIAGNNRGLEVSDLIKPNMVKTIDDLNVNYPNIQFTIDNDNYYKEATTNMIQVINEWLRGKEGVEKYFDGKINLVPRENAGFLGIPVPGGVKLEFGEKIVDPMYLQKNPIRDIETPLQVFDHELAHAIDYVIREKEKKLLNEFIKKNKDSPEFREEVNTILKEYFSVSPENAEESFKSTAGLIVFKNHIAKQFNLPKEQEGILFAEGMTGLQNYGMYPTLMQSIKEMESSKDFAEFVQGYNELKKSHGLSVDNLNSLDNFLWDFKKLEVDKEVKDDLKDYLKRKLDPILKQNTGIYYYSLTDVLTGGNELFSTYGELSPETARKHIELAQVEFDRVMSTDPPKWLKQRAEDRYYAIMGGKEGAYCKTNPCGQCLRYKLTCNTESIS